MVRQNQRCGGGNVQPLFHVRHACRNQFVDFAEQGFGGNYHAGTDEAVQFFVQDAAGNQAQDGFFAVHHQSVPRIVAALKTHHASGLFGQPVHDFAFAFIAPLRADDDYVLCHMGVTFWV